MIVHVSAALRTPGLSTGERCVLTLLADYAGTDARCWPSIATMARDLGLDRTTIQRHLRALTTAGLVTTEARTDHTGRQTSTLYTLHLPVDNQGGGLHQHRPPRAAPAPPPGAAPAPPLEALHEPEPPKPPSGGPSVQRLEAEGQLTLFDRVDQALEVAAQIAAVPTRRRARWCDQQRPQALDLARRFDRAPPSMLAARLLGEPTPYLHHYRTTQSTEGTR